MWEPHLLPSAGPVLDRIVLLELNLRADANVAVLVRLFNGLLEATEATAAGRDRAAAGGRETRLGIGLLVEPQALGRGVALLLAVYRHFTVRMTRTKVQ